MMFKFKTPKSLKRFFANQRASMATMTAITAVPMMLFAGTAIDFARLNAAQTHVQNALDAAALTAASLKKATPAQRIAAAQKSFDINVGNGFTGGTKPVATFEVVNEAFVATADLEVPSAFMHFAGINMMEGQSRTEVNILIDKKAEIVMVLDYSSSMYNEVGGKVKYEVMKDAAIKLVTDLSKSDPDNVKFGLVPFSNHVRTSMPGSFVIGGGGGQWTGCTQDRKHPYNKTDATPTGDADSLWNQSLYTPTAADIKNKTNDADQLKSDCKSLQKNKLKTVDLTKKFKDVTAQLDDMTPYGYTHIALGVEFGYHMLSPNAPFTQGEDYNDKTTKKFMVVLTDGAQTTRGFGGSGRTVSDANDNFVALCKNAKAEGITMMTMAFDLDDVPTVERLQNCASDPSKNFFNANDSDSLAAAFESIKKAVTAQVFLNK